VAATVVVAGDDLGAEVCARALAAAGVGTLRLVRRGGPPPETVLWALRASNPEVNVETRAWPRVTLQESAGTAWTTAIAGAAAIVRSGFDDDALLRAAVRLGVPAVIMRGTGAAADVISFRKHGPCPHLDLAVPEQGAGLVPDEGPAAVVAAQLAAAEALVIIAGAATGVARARHVRVTLDGDPSEGPTRAADVPWTPECVACGGTADAGILAPRDPLSLS
jgi:hypothetical protein